MKGRLHTSRLIFWLPVLVVQLFFAGYQVSQQNFYLADSYEYLQEAQNIMQEGSFYCGDLEQPIRTDFYTKRPPLYPLLLTLFTLLGSPVFWAILLQNALALFNLWLGMKLLEAFGFPSRMRIYLLPFVLLYPAQFIYANMIMTEIVLQSLILAMVWDWLYFYKDQKVRHVVRYHLWLVLAIMLKPVIFPFALLNLLLLPWLVWKHPQRGKLIPLVLLPLLVIGGYAGWNKARTGAFHYSSIQQINLLQYNTYYTLLAAEGPEAASQQVDWIVAQADAMTDYAQRQNFIQSSSVALLSKYPLTYLQLHIRGTVNFMLDPGRFDLSSFFGMEKRDGKGKGFLYYYSKEGYKGIASFLASQSLPLLVLLLLVALLNLMKLLALFYVFFWKKLSWPFKVLLMIWLVYLAGITGPLGASRFALPVFPIMLIVTGLAAMRWRGNLPVFKNS